MFDAIWTGLTVPAPSEDEWATVIAADDRLFDYEADTLLAEFEPPSVPDLSYGLSPCSPADVREEFLDRVRELRDRASL